MELQTINDLTNDILVDRLTITSLEQELEALMQAPEIVKLQQEIEAIKYTRDSKQAELIGIMASNNLKQWKTGQATFTKAERVSVRPNEAYKKSVEKALKAGESILGWEMNKTEYISIRITPIK
jgi:hypothetical protein